MATRATRLLFYLALAIICYLSALRFGTGAGFLVFLIAGGVGELLFWKELLWPSPSSS